MAVLQLESAAREALEQFRPALAADGAALHLLSTSAASVKVGLTFAPDGCRECLVPLPLMESMLATAIGRRLGRAVNVGIQLVADQL
jgi:Fe-S cluster biogenesis protein NfuA